MVVFWFQNGTIMASITIKNVPDELFALLKEQAKFNHRSLNSEIIFAIQLYLMRKKARPNPEEILGRARELRRKVKGTTTSDDIEGAINEGRK